MGFAAFVANSARYAAVYSSLAIMIVFLIWLYVGWLIFLVGGEVTYFHQYPSVFVHEALQRGRGHRLRNGWPLRPLSRLRGPFFRQKSLAIRRTGGLSRSLSLDNFIDKFVRAGILLRSADLEGVALARPPEAVTIKDILDIVDDSATQDDQNAGPAADILRRRDQAVQNALDGITLKSLAAENRSTIVRFPRSGSGTN